MQAKVTLVEHTFVINYVHHLIDEYFDNFLFFSKQKIWLEFLLRKTRNNLGTFGMTLKVLSVVLQMCMNKKLYSRVIVSGACRGDVKPRIVNVWSTRSILFDVYNETDRANVLQTVT